MSAQLPVIVHERRNTWARQLRPRLAGSPARIVESRSGEDLAAACRRSACPILVADLGDRPLAVLADLERALDIAPNALSLVLDPAGHREIPAVARQIGATHVVSGRATPPAVLRLVERWIARAARRAEADGWADEPRPELEPWEALLCEELGIPPEEPGPGRRGARWASVDR